MAIKQSMLLRGAKNYEQPMFESTQGSQLKTAFLCHSHKDEDLVKGLIASFSNEGIELYVDWKDHLMPDKPNATTARKIQGKIRESDVFLFFATENSKASRWCPWEIGYADIKKNIYIIPTEDQRGTNYGNEYLDLYDRIDFKLTGYVLLKAGEKTGNWLSASML